MKERFHGKHSPPGGEVELAHRAEHHFLLPLLGIIPSDNPDFIKHLLAYRACVNVVQTKPHMAEIAHLGRMSARSITTEEASTAVADHTAIHNYIYIYLFIYRKYLDDLTPKGE